MPCIAKVTLRCALETRDQQHGRARLRSVPGRRCITKSSESRNQSEFSRVVVSRPHLDRRTCVTARAPHTRRPSASVSRSCLLFSLPHFRDNCFSRAALLLHSPLARTASEKLLHRWVIDVFLSPRIPWFHSLDALPVHAPLALAQEKRHTSRNFLGALVLQKLPAAPSIVIALKISSLLVLRALCRSTLPQIALSLDTC